MDNNESKLYPCDGEMLTDEQIEDKLSGTNYTHEYCIWAEGIYPLEGLGGNCWQCEHKSECRGWPAISARNARNG